MRASVKLYADVASKHTSSHTQRNHRKKEKIIFFTLLLFHFSFEIAEKLYFILAEKGRVGEGGRARGWERKRKKERRKKIYKKGRKAILSFTPSFSCYSMYVMCMNIYPEMVNIYIFFFGNENAAAFNLGNMYA